MIFKRFDGFGIYSTEYLCIPLQRLLQNYCVIPVGRGIMCRRIQGTCLYIIGMGIYEQVKKKVSIKC